MYELTKISDNRFNGHHPNGIHEGIVYKGKVKELPTVGKSFNIQYKHKTGIGFGVFYTSEVTKVISDGTFETLNSTYKLRKIDNESE